MNQTSYTMPNTLEAVDHMVLQLKAAATEALNSSAIKRFEICIIEALTNAVEHAWVGKKREPIDMALFETSDQITFQLFDPIGAPSFDIRDHAAELSEIDVLSESGRGLGLIIQCADLIDYEQIDGRNCLKLTFLKIAQT